jgi:glutamate 5-kinase
MDESVFDFTNVKQAVIKVGSNVLTEKSGLNLRAIRSISRQICNLIETGIQVILISSGAMAAGIRKMGLASRPEQIPKRQAVAAVGQAGLIMEYENAFERYGNKVAQILLTSDDFTNRKRYLNARNTIYTLLSWDVLPIVNENDTIAVEEINVGDNDNLAAMIALLMNADILINLTDIDGLYTKDPRTSSDACLMPVIAKIGKDVEQFASSIPGALGRGGMLGKIKAARKVTAAGIPMIIANGKKSDILLSIFKGEMCGTYFVPKKEKLASRKRWIGYSLKPEGMLHIDDGAADALVNNGKSLLPSGIIGVEGKFEVGAPVEFGRLSGQPLGNGLVNYNSADIRKIMGLKSHQIKTLLGNKPYDYVIHRDNLVIIR